MFQLINQAHLKLAETIVKHINVLTIDEVAAEIDKLISIIRNDIPEKKRISYGRYGIIKKLGIEMYPMLKQNDIDVLEFASNLYTNIQFEQFVRSFGVQIISIYGVETKKIEEVLPIFEQAATDEKWEVRECSAGFVRKLVKTFPDRMKKWYLKQVTSDNPMSRRFASESIRPVADNSWLKKNPEFCFEVIKNLFAESKDYPRSSVGNNLSDWARIDKERVYKIVQKLADSGNKNSYWIAYRACRNLVKNEPLKVMDILKIDKYKYKNRIYYRHDY
ncbi:MAG: DNA alkylation repair protein [Bacteroidales bacterium]|nr:DNA alkylation repair protein [Bacteroidales bacterium]